MSFKVIQGHRFWYESKAHCNFLLVIITNLHSISHRFQVIEDYRSSLRWLPLLAHSSAVNPKLKTTKFSLRKLKTSFNQSYGVDTLTHDYFVLSQCTRLTDGQTDRQTERQNYDSEMCFACNAVAP